VRAEVASPSAQARPVHNEQGHARRQDDSATKVQPVNYRKLSDEQILEL
jgi:hypothetical protein